MSPTTPQVADRLADPLAQLRGIHLPDPVGLWPPAPGWWMLAALVATACATAFVVVRRRRRSLGRHALREVDRVASAGADLQHTAAALSELVRRVALRRFGADRVAALHGEGWERFLVETGPPAKRGRAGVDPAVGHVLALAPYAPPGAPSMRFDDTTIDRDGLVRAVGRWIRWNT